MPNVEDGRSSGLQRLSYWYQQNTIRLGLKQIFTDVSNWYIELQSSEEEPGVQLPKRSDNNEKKKKNNDGNIVQLKLGKLNEDK